MAADSFIQRFDNRQNTIQSFGFVIASCVCILFSVLFMGSDISRSEQSSKILLDSRISPNSAPAVSLIRLPGIGISRAKAIVAYRENLAKLEGRGRAFETIEDLQTIKGIGPKTSQNINKWLKFE